MLPRLSLREARFNLKIKKDTGSATGNHKGCPYKKNTKLKL